MSSSKNINEKLPNKIKLYNAVKVDSNNLCIERNNSKCIDCGLCATVCKDKIKKRDIYDINSCIGCGQCVTACPTSALIPKNDIIKLKLALESNKTCIAYVAPAVRVSLGEVFGMSNGSFVQEQLVASLRKIGIKYVFDVTTGADLTVVEETCELINRIKSATALPMFTSCCPAWVKYVENFHRELLPHLSTCKSPISMQGAIVSKYFCEKSGIDLDNIFTIAITPCTAKKYEVSRKELFGTDIVITTSELGDFLKQENIDFKNLEPSNFDEILGEGSGAGMMFGVSGGVSEAIIRTAYKMLTNEDLPESKLIIKSMRENSAIKDISINIKGIQINVAVINGISNVEEFINTSCGWQNKYHLIEVMSCEGGCVGGGGQPKTQNMSIINKRSKALCDKDKISKVRLSYKNPEIIKLYKDFLIKPNSLIAEEILHINYKDHNKTN